MFILNIISEIMVQRKRLISLFLTLIVGGVLLIGIRQFLPTDKMFIFLIWNLFLALVPLCLSSFLQVANQQNLGLKTIILLGFVWLLFFPNAPYMLTDFIHLSYGSKNYLWLDILTISWFSITALLAGIISLNDMVKILQTKFSTKNVSFFLFVISILSGFGIYLGRYLRFNSWDVISKPQIIVFEIVDRIIHPNLHPRTWMVTLGFGCLIWLVYKGINYVSEEFNKTN